MPDKKPVIDHGADNGHFCVLIFFLSAGHQPVKVTLIQPILYDTVFLKFTFGKGFCNILFAQMRNMVAFLEFTR